jgi:hypothetical protein
MEIETAIFLLLLGSWGLLLFRREMKGRRYKTVLTVNVDSTEKDEYDLPKQSIQMRKTVQLCAPVVQGMLVEADDTDRHLRVVESLVGETCVAAYLEPIIVSSSAVENEANGLTQFQWYRQD